MHNMSCKKPTQEKIFKNLNMTLNKIITTNQKPKKKIRTNKEKRKKQKNGKTFTS